MRCSVGMVAAGAAVLAGILPTGLSGGGEGRVKIAFGRAGWVKPAPAPTL
ncbi:hypothetical protein O164_04930 [Pseudomonas taiwanensis SJ9]|uniref:Uncharacterized protein n=1 Tax=Pseudomonas taiwanensis SJ9 TaxID=1388762 RepID=V7DGS5_9PSED|nr:hypothetical protein O164_04930 [Pseudomonas taiwanensis SJ9]